MGAELLRLAIKQSKKLSTTAPVTYWSLLSQLYHAHKDNADIEALGPVIRARDFDAALDLADDWSSQQYSSAYVHYVRNQFAYLIKKQILPSKYDPEARAWEAFQSAELDCSKTNRRFQNWCFDTDFGVSKRRAAFNEQLRKMRSFISYTIGETPMLDQVFEKVGFGPGASLGVHGKATNAMRKLTVEELTITPRAVTYFAAAVSKNLWLRRVFSSDPDGHTDGRLSWLTAVRRVAKYVRYNNITFVSKTAKVLRTIAVEPLGNSVLQKGVELVLKLCLKRIGIDLSSQTLNQEMAREGSLGFPRKLSTIDLKAASDSVAWWIVRKLFPPDWFELLNSLRSAEYQHGGLVGTYAKFSSMGNGTTFPIETLIFTAACVAVGCGSPGRDFTVYGDDIVVPSEKAGELISLLRVLGFRTNTDKTFVSGPFRESCGEDWFEGISVRPFVFDYALDSVENVFKFLNQTKNRPEWVEFFAPVRSYVLRLLPVKLHLYRPFKGAVDGGIDAGVDEASRSDTCQYIGNGVWKWLEIAHRPKKDTRYVATQTGMWEEPPDHVMWYGVHTLTSGINAINRRVWKPWVGPPRKRDRSGPGEQPWFTLRRAVKTTMTWESHGGAESNWLPGQRWNSSAGTLH